MIQNIKISTKISQKSQRLIPNSILFTTIIYSMQYEYYNNTYKSKYKTDYIILELLGGAQMKFPGYTEKLFV